jgi:hypothetical protein
MAHALRLAPRREVLEGAHPQVAGGHTGEHRAGQHLLADDPLARAGHGQRAGGGDAQRVQGLADQHLAQHRPHGRLAVAPTRKGCTT